MALFNTVPHSQPNRMARGVEMMAAKVMPYTPATCQSLTKIRPICPAMAPRTMPKLRPMPAMMGMSNDNTRNALRDSRISISCTRYSMEKCEIGMAMALTTKNTMGTAFRIKNSFTFSPVFIVFMISPSSRGSERTESSRWTR